jgi:hypothetical protein
MKMELNQKIVLVLVIAFLAALGLSLMNVSTSNISYTQDYANLTNYLKSNETSYQRNMTWDCMNDKIENVTYCYCQEIETLITMPYETET